MFAPASVDPKNQSPLEQQQSGLLLISQERCRWQAGAVGLPRPERQANLPPTCTLSYAFLWRHREMAKMTVLWPTDRDRHKVQASTC